MSSETTSKRVAVTGAGGRLGKHVCRELLAAGYAVRAFDKQPSQQDGYEVIEADCLDKAACYSLVENCHAVIHLANHTHYIYGDVQTIFSENVTMNINVFQAAAEARVKRIVFASSIHAINGERPDVSRENQEPMWTRIPVDSSVRRSPRSSYGLSKATGEQMLDYYVDNYPLTAASIRYPLLIDREGLVKYATEWAPLRYGHDLYAYLPWESAAELTRRCVDADLAGHRMYFPAAKANYKKLSPSEVYRESLSFLPLSCPIEELDSLVDCRSIEAETGWRQPDGF